MKIRTAVILLVLTACSAPAPEKKAWAPAQVRTIEATLQNVVPEISSFGSLTYIKKADVVAAVEGILETQPFREGDFVDKDAVLATLSNIQLHIKQLQAQSAIDSAQANAKLAVARWEDGKKQVEARFLGLEKSAIDLARKQKEVDNQAQTLANKRELFAVGGITSENLQGLENSYASAVSELASSQKDLEVQRIGLRDEDLTSLGLDVPADAKARRQLLVQINTRTLAGEVDVANAQLESSRTEMKSIDQLLNELTIRSPLRGVVGARFLETGERAQAGTKLFTIFESGDAYVVFPIQESQVVLLRKGQVVDAVVDALGGKAFSARVDNLAPVIDPQSGNLTVKALVNRPDPQLRPGMFARVSVKTGQKIQRIVLPETVLAQKTDTKALIYVLKAGRVFRREVVIAKQENGKLELEKGLSPGEEVVDNPSPGLEDGETVEVARAN